MEMEITQNEKNYVFKTKNLNEEIAQNIENIVTRIKGNVPLARHKGIIAENIDKPQLIIEAEMTADTVEEIEREEKRFKVSEINLTSNNEVKTLVQASVKGEIIDD